MVAGIIKHAWEPVGFEPHSVDGLRSTKIVCAYKGTTFSLYKALHEHREANSRLWL